MEITNLGEEGVATGIEKDVGYQKITKWEALIQ